MNAYNFGQIEVRKGEYRISGMSHALRHAPSDYGLTLNDDGTVLVEDLANAFNVSVDDILKVVETDAKGRYGLVDGEDNALRIRALHGHSGQTVYLTATGIYLANVVPVEFITEIVYA